MLSEELGLQKLLKGREGRPCSGSVRQFVPPVVGMFVLFQQQCCNVSYIILFTISLFNLIPVLPPCVLSSGVRCASEWPYRGEGHGYI